MRRMRRQNQYQNAKLIALVNKSHVHMTRMAIYNKQTTLIACFRDRTALKYCFQPIQAQRIATPPIFRNSEVSLVLRPPILYSSILQCPGVSTVDEGRREGSSVCPDTSQETDELPAAILTGVGNAAGKQGLYRHNALCRAPYPNQEALFIPVI